MSTAAKRAKQRRRRDAKEKQKEGEVFSRTCQVCYDVFPKSKQQPHVFRLCVRKHFLCATCLASYVRVCAEQYYMNRIPVRCPMDDCGHVVYQSTIRQALCHPNLPADSLSWDQYQVVEIRAGLLQQAMKEGETAVTCPTCNLYAEIYPSDFRQRAKLLQRGLMAFQKRQAMKQKNETFLKAVASSEIPGAMGLHLPHVEVKQKEEKQEQPVAHYHQQQQQQPVQEKATTNTSSIQSEIKVEEVKAKESKEQPIDVSLAPPALNKRQISVERFKPETDPNIGLTSMFFECKLDGCGTTVCLRCNGVAKTLEERQYHKCIDEIQELYEEVIELLAKGSVQSCPKCQECGMKDLNCTHITCHKCNTCWCYCCTMIRPSDGFGQHNTYTAECLDTDNKCPMYLPYKYGDNFDKGSGQWSGDANQALIRFHIVKQQKLIKQFQEKLGSVELWEHLVEKKFPQGIWDANQLKVLEKIEKTNQQYRDEKEQLRTEAERKRLEAERKREEELRRREENRLQQIANQQQIAAERRQQWIESVEDISGLFD